MKYRLTPIIFFALIYWHAPGTALPAEVWNLDTIPVAEIKPGMTGVGKTVFYGEEVDTFGVVVIDVVKNFYPQQDVIIVRLTGEKCEHTGVVAGMSGSPVYLQGKLAGAIALRLGDFQKDPIAGVMPIESMMRARDFESERGATRPNAPQAGVQYLRAVLLGAEPDFWQHILAPLVPMPEAKMAARRIESPLLFSGFSEQTLAAVAPVWSSLGFAPMAGGAALQEESSPARAIEPGSALSQVFIRGDYGMDMTGTVTAVDGDQILAFGHYLFNLGPTQMPMARSRVLVTLSSLMGSSKMARSVEIIGSIRQDRLSGVYGKVGAMPEWIPVTVDLGSRGADQTFRFELADDPALRNLMPFFMRTALFQALVTGKLGAEPSTVRLRCEIALQDGRKVSFADFISYQERLGFLGAGSEIAEAVDLVTMSMGALMVNEFNPPPVKSVTVHAEIEPGERVAVINTIRQDRLEASPGDSMHLAMTLRRSDGREMKYSQCICLPRYLQARSLTVIAGGAAGMVQTELLGNPDKYRADSFPRLCELLQARRAANNLYVQIREPAEGMAVDGEELTALPPSIMEVMSGRGGERYLRDRVLAEWVIPTDCEITGLKRISVRIAQPKKNRQDYGQGFSDTPFLE
jgi:hypothetical protein